MKQDREPSDARPPIRVIPAHGRGSGPDSDGGEETNSHVTTVGLEMAWWSVVE